MYCFQLACLAEDYGTTFECDIEDAEFIIVNVQDIRHKSDNQCFDDLGDLYDFVSAHGKAIHVVEFGLTRYSRLHPACQVYTRPSKPYLQSLDRASHSNRGMESINERLKLGRR